MYATYSFVYHCILNCDEYSCSSFILSPCRACILCNYSTIGYHSKCSSININIIINIIQVLCYFYSYIFSYLYSYSYEKLIMWSFEDLIHFTESISGIKETLSIGYLELTEYVLLRLPLFVSTYDVVVLNDRFKFSEYTLRS